MFSFSFSLLNINKMYNRANLKAYIYRCVEINQDFICFIKTCIDFERTFFKVSKKDLWSSCNIDIAKTIQAESKSKEKSNK